MNEIPNERNNIFDQLEKYITIFHSDNASVDSFSQDNINNYVKSYKDAYDFALLNMDRTTIINAELTSSKDIDKLNALFEFEDFFTLYKSSCKLFNYHKSAFIEYNYLNIEYNYLNDEDKLRNLFEQHKNAALPHTAQQSANLTQSVNSVSNVLIQNAQKVIQKPAVKESAIQEPAQKREHCSLFSCCKKKQKADTSGKQETAALTDTARQSADLTQSVKSFNSVVVLNATLEKRSKIPFSDVATSTTGLNATNMEKQPLLGKNK